MMTRVAILTILALGLFGSICPGEIRLQAADNMAGDTIDGPKNQGANEHMSIARYYIGRRDYTGTLNRLKIVLTKFPRDQNVEEALARLAEAYLALGGCFRGQYRRGCVGS